MYTKLIQEQDLYNTPIDYYKIKERFFSNNCNVEFIEDIQQNENGYITNKLVEKFKSYDVKEKFTSLINAGVGKGKSTSIIQIGRAHV